MKTMSPGDLLKEFITSYITENSLDKSLSKEIPKRWEKYGDFVLFDQRTFCSDVWKRQEDRFWLEITKILKCRRIGVKNKIKNDGYRTPNVTIVYGRDPWIFHKDNSITYTWNVEKSMFSAGNACEKHRIAKLDCQGEVVVDLFAGIGYFTLPFLVHSKAAFVHACEWNPIAVEALRRNLVLNKVDDKCKIYEGDSNLVCPKNIANRVNLGLIPTSESHWRTACGALVSEGGILHIHENVETKKYEIVCDKCSLLLPESPPVIEKNILMKNADNFISQGLRDICWKHKQWLLKAVHILHTINSILSIERDSKQWCCTVEKVNFVKSYAPHVNHIVYDIKVENTNS